MKVQEILGRQAIPCRDDLETLFVILDQEPNTTCVAIKSYNFGVIQGKRQERIRKSCIK